MLSDQSKMPPKPPYAPPNLRLNATGQFLPSLYRMCSSFFKASPTSHCTPLFGYLVTGHLLTSISLPPSSVGLLLCAPSTWGTVWISFDFNVWLMLPSVAGDGVRTEAGCSCEGRFCVVWKWKGNGRSSCRARGGLLGRVRGFRRGILGGYSAGALRERERSMQC